MEPIPMPAEGALAPRQQRSRDVYARIMRGSEEILLHDGIGSFTIQNVAIAAQVSVGQIYRRFESREQILIAVKKHWNDILESRFEENLGRELGTLHAVLSAYTDTIAAVFAERGNLFYELQHALPTGTAPSGRQSFERSREIFLRQALPHMSEILVEPPEAALRFVWESLTGSMIHRAMVNSSGTGWPDFARRSTAMAFAYLTGDSRGL